MINVGDELYREEMAGRSERERRRDEFVRLVMALPEPRQDVVLKAVEKIAKKGASVTIVERLMRRWTYIDSRAPA